MPRPRRTGARHPKAMGEDDESPVQYRRYAVSQVVTAPLSKADEIVESGVEDCGFLSRTSLAPLLAALDSELRSRQEPVSLPAAGTAETAPSRTSTPTNEIVTSPCLLTRQCETVNDR